MEFVDPAGRMFCRGFLLGHYILKLRFTFDIWHAIISKIIKRGGEGYGQL